MKIFVSYFTLDRLSDWVAVVLQTSFVPITHQDCVVSFCTSLSECTIVYLLAVLKAGMLYIPIDKNATYEKKRYILKESKTALLIVDNGRKYN